MDFFLLLIEMDSELVIELEDFALPVWEFSTVYDCCLVALV